MRNFGSVKQFFDKLSPSKNEQKRLKRDQDDDCEDASNAQQQATSFTQHDKHFLRVLVDQIGNAVDEKISKANASIIAEQTSIRQEVLHLKAENIQLKQEVKSLQENGIAKANLDSIKSNIVEELKPQLLKEFKDQNIFSPSGLYSQGECEKRAREVLQKIGADDPSELYAPLGFGGHVHLRYSEHHQAKRTRSLLKLLPQKYEGQDSAVWMDVKKSRQERLPKLTLKELERAISELKTMLAKSWNIVKCSTTKRIYINKEECVRLGNDGVLSWNSTCPVEQEHQIEIATRIETLRNMNSA